MFDFVRSHTRLLQGVLVLLVFPSFVFFGVQGYSHFMDQAAATVATVDGQPIRQSELEAAHRQQVERMRRQVEYHLAHARASAAGGSPSARCHVATSADAL